MFVLVAAKAIVPFIFTMSVKTNESFWEFIGKNEFRASLKQGRALGPLTKAFQTYWEEKRSANLIIVPCCWFQHVIINGLYNMEFLCIFSCFLCILTRKNKTKSKCVCPKTDSFS